MYFALESLLSVTHLIVFDCMTTFDIFVSTNCFISNYYIKFHYNWRYQDSFFNIIKSERSLRRHGGLWIVNVGRWLHWSADCYLKSHWCFAQVQSLLETQNLRSDKRTRCMQSMTGDHVLLSHPVLTSECALDVAPEKVSITNPIRETDKGKKLHYTRVVQHM